MKILSEFDLHAAKRHGKLIGEIKTVPPAEIERPEITISDVLNAVVAVSRDVRATADKDTSQNIVASLNAIGQQVQKLFTDLSVEQKKDRKTIEELVSRLAKEQLKAVEASKSGKWKFTIERDYGGQVKSVVAKKCE